MWPIFQLLTYSVRVRKNSLLVKVCSPHITPHEGLSHPGLSVFILFYVSLHEGRILWAETEATHGATEYCSILPILLYLYANELPTPTMLIQWKSLKGILHRLGHLWLKGRSTFVDGTPTLSPIIILNSKPAAPGRLLTVSQELKRPKRRWTS